MHCYLRAWLLQDGGSAGTIVGIIVVVAVLLLCVAVAIFGFLYWRRGQAQQRAAVAYASGSNRRRSKVKKKIKIFFFFFLNFFYLKMFCRHLVVQWAATAAAAAAAAVSAVDRVHLDHVGIRAAAWAARQQRSAPTAAIARALRRAATRQRRISKLRLQ